MNGLSVPRRIPKGGWMIASLVLVLVFGVGGGRAMAAPPFQSADEGKQIFEQKCSFCHTVGQGDRAGPDLKGVTAARDRTWLTRWLTAPDKLLAEKDPIAVQLAQKFNNLPMPNQGLSATDVASLIAYLESTAGGAAPQQSPQGQPASAAASLKGNILDGKSLFMGVTRFQNSGPSCMACHSVDGIGAVGGGALGPDLTPTFTKYGGALGLTAFLAGAPTPVMKAVWGQKPLSAQEQADVVAFLQQASSEQQALDAQQPAQVVWQFIGLAVAGAALVLGLMQLIWRRRLRAVREPMVAGRS